jgi:biotin carboxyl carrier protein
MKWQILINGHAADIDPGRLDAVKEVEPGVYSVVLEGDSFEVRLLPAGPGWIAEVNGKRYPVEVRDPRNARRNSKNALGSGRQNVAAPMPGKVIRVLVREGDPVEAGQGLVVVEAMKMQNELKASRPARVVSVLARAGDTIGAGDTLVVLE